MADRSISVALEASVTGFVNGFKTAEQSVKDFGSRTASYVEKNSADMAKVGAAGMIMGGSILAGVGLAIGAYTEFSGRMAQVQSLSHAGAADMDTLANSALHMGENIGLSANQVADAEIELTKAGVGVKDMMGGALVGALNLASAGQIGVGEATEIATVAMTQFKLAGKDVPHLADLLAAGADKALGGVDELGQGLKQSGLVAAQFGLTIDDTVGTLSAFANAGLMGSDAGTSFKTMLLSLAKPSEQSQAAMDKLGISAYDTQGKFVGITSLAGQLQDKLGGLSAAERDSTMALIFGTDAIRAANVLYSEGANGIQSWIDKVNDSGFAAMQAAGKLDSLQGDFQKLQASVQNGLIEMGAASDGFLRPVIQGMTGAVRSFNELPEPIKGGALAIASMTGAGLLLGGMFISVVPKAFETITALKTLRAESTAFTTATNLMGKATLGAAAAIGILAAAAAVSKTMEPAAASIEHTSQAIMGLKQNSGSVDDLFKSFEGTGLAAEGINGVGDALHRINNMDLNENVNKWFNDVAGIGDKLKPAREQIAQLDTSLANFASSGSMDVAANGFRKIAQEAEAQGVSVETTAKSFPSYIAALEAQATAAHVSVTEQELLAWATGKVPPAMIAAQQSAEGQAAAAKSSADAVQKQSDALTAVGVSAGGAIIDIDKFTQSLVNTGLVTLSARDAESQFQAALDAVDQKIKDVNGSASALNPVLNQTGTDFDLTSAAGRDANSVFADLETKGLNSAKAMATAGASQQDVQGKLNDTYNSLVTTAKGFGLSDDAAKGLAASAMGVPKNVNVESWMSDAAKAMAEQTKAAMDQINGKTVNTYTIHHDTTFVEVKETVSGGADAMAAAGNRKAAFATGGIVRKADGGPIRGYASGYGLLRGPGTGTSDSIPAMLSNGEYVMKASSVSQYGEEFFDALNSGRYQAPPAYAATPAGGGPAGPMEMTGTLVLDSGELMGTFRGVATQVAGKAVQTWAADQKMRRVGA